MPSYTTSLLKNRGFPTLPVDLLPFRSMNYKSTVKVIYTKQVELDLAQIGLNDETVDDLCQEVEEEILDRYPSAKSIQRLVTYTQCLPILKRKALIQFEILT